MRFWPVHRFYFHLYEGSHAVLDQEGLELPSFEIALQKAAAVARDIVAADAHTGRICMRSRVDIVDSYGIVLAELPFSEAVAIVA